MAKKTYTKDDLYDLFLDLTMAAAEHYDNALDGISFDEDNAHLIKPIEELINSLPEDFILEVEDND